MEPFSGEAIAVLAQAREHAHRLGHRYIGAELRTAILGRDRRAS